MLPHHGHRSTSGNGAQAYRVQVLRSRLHPQASLPHLARITAPTTIDISARHHLHPSRTPFATAQVPHNNHFRARRRRPYPCCSIAAPPSPYTVADPPPGRRFVGLPPRREPPAYQPPGLHGLQDGVRNWRRRAVQPEQLGQCPDHARYPSAQHALTIVRVEADDLYAGLVSFIADLRNARARELEEKRINKELANIRCVSWTSDAWCNTDSLQAKVQRYAPWVLGCMRGLTQGLQMAASMVTRRRSMFARRVSPGQPKCRYTDDLATLYLHSRMECRFRPSRSRQPHLGHKVLGETDWLSCRHPILARRARTAASRRE